MDKQNLSKTPRWFLLVAVAMCAVFLASGNNGNSTKFESYPAVYLEKLADASAEAQKVEGLYARILNANLEKLDDEDRAEVSMNIPQEPRQWYRVQAHPFLSKVLPEVKFYIVAGSQGYDPCGPKSDWLIAFRDTSWYGLPGGLNQLLYDCGMRFRDEDVPVWAKVGALVWASEYRCCPYISGADPMTDHWELPCFPKLTFEHVELDKKRGGYGSAEILIRAGEKRIKLGVLTGSFAKPDPEPAGICPIQIMEGSHGPSIMIEDPHPPRTDPSDINFNIPFVNHMFYANHRTDNNGQPIKAGYCVVKNSGGATNGELRGHNT